ncbi:hypothetical protein [Mycobacterium sp.]
MVLATARASALFVPGATDPAQAAPRITVAVLVGWTAAPGDGDMALRLSGPDDMTAVVAIAATTRDPGADFADRVTHSRTNTGIYLVTIHLEGPVGAAKTALVHDFAIVIS